MMSGDFIIGMMAGAFVMAIICALIAMLTR